MSEFQTWLYFLRCFLNFQYLLLYTLNSMAVYLNRRWSNTWDESYTKLPMLGYFTEKCAITLAIYCLFFYFGEVYSVTKMLRPRQYFRHFAHIFQWIFLNEYVWISLLISLKFVLNVRINNILVLVQIIDWLRSGDKPFSEPMMFRLLTHICVTRRQWFNFCSIKWPKLSLIIVDQWNWIKINHCS